MRGYSRRLNDACLLVLLLLAIQHLLHVVATVVLLRWSGRRILLLGWNAVWTDDANKIVVIGLLGWATRWSGCVEVALFEAGRATHDAVASTAVAFDINVVYGFDAVGVLMGRRIHPGEESCVTPRAEFRCGSGDLNSER